MQINLQQIATIYSPFCTLSDMPTQPIGAKETYATISFKKEYQDGLKDLESFSHLYLIYYFHKVEEHKLSVIPFHDKTNTPRGVFATRTPMHPNGIGLSVVKLVSVKENVVTIQGIDVLDGTPLLDIKPYIENFDKVLGEVKSGWMHSSTQEVEAKRSDDRFL